MFACAACGCVVACCQLHSCPAYVFKLQIWPLCHTLGDCLRDASRQNVSQCRVRMLSILTRVPIHVMTASFVVEPALRSSDCGTVVVLGHYCLHRQLARTALRDTIRIRSTTGLLCNNVISPRSLCMRVPLCDESVVLLSF